MVLEMLVYLSINDAQQYQGEKKNIGPEKFEAPHMAGSFQPLNNAAHQKGALQFAANFFSNMHEKKIIKEF